MENIESKSIEDMTGLSPLDRIKLDLARMESDWENGLITDDLQALEQLMEFFKNCLNNLTKETIRQDKEWEEFQLEMLMLSEQIDEIEKQRAEHIKDIRIPAGHVMVDSKEIEQLQVAFEELQTNLAQHQEWTGQNRQYAESLGDFTRDLDRRKIDQKELERIEADVIQRTTIDGREEQEEIKALFRNLQDAVKEIDRKRERMWRSQVHETDVTDQIFVKLEKKLSKQEADQLLDRRLAQAFKQLRNELGHMIGRKENEGGPCSKLRCGENRSLRRPNYTMRDVSRYRIAKGRCARRLDTTPLEGFLRTELRKQLSNTKFGRDSKQLRNEFRHMIEEHMV